MRGQVAIIGGELESGHTWSKSNRSHCGEIPNNQQCDFESSSQHNLCGRKCHSPPPQATCQGLCLTQIFTIWQTIFFSKFPKSGSFVLTWHKEYPGIYVCWNFSFGHCVQPNVLKPSQLSSTYAECKPSFFLTSLPRCEVTSICPAHCDLSH